MAAPPDAPQASVADPAFIALLVSCCAIYALNDLAGSVAAGDPFPMAAWLRRFMDVLVTYLTAIAFVVAIARVAPRRFALRAAILALALALGIVLAQAVLLGAPALLEGWHSSRFRLLTSPLRYLGIGLLGVALFLMAERASAARQSLHEEQQRRMQLTRAVDEARMAMLRSQVEPHFLFNVLAHLRRLYATEPAAARAMMSDLARYLGDARPALQRDSVSLQEDAALALAYLNLQKVRMGPRLEFSFDLEPAALTARLPPLALTILVENAIEHGLATRPTGGRVTVRAIAEGPVVRLAVEDDGRGFGPTQGTGVGLANLRARLAALHQGAAALALRENAGGGVTATLHVPIAAPRKA